MGVGMYAVTFVLCSHVYHVVLPCGSDTCSISKSTACIKHLTSIQSPCEHSRYLFLCVFCQTGLDHTDGMMLMSAAIGNML